MSRYAWPSASNVSGRICRLTTGSSRCGSESSAATLYFNDPSRSASSRGVLGVRLPHQEFEILVHVRRFGQSKVNAVPEPAKRLDPMQTSVLDRAPQPEGGIEPIVVHDCAGKSDPCLKHDPRLLCVHGHRPACARQCSPLVEELPHDKGPVLEVVGQSVVAARVPEISTGKPMPALGASPQRRSFRHHVSSNPVLSALPLRGVRRLVAGRGDPLTAR